MIFLFVGSKLFFESCTSSVFCPEMLNVCINISDHLTLTHIYCTYEHMYTSKYMYKDDAIIRS